MKDATMLLIAFLSVFAIYGCKDDDPQPTQEELKIKALTGTWSVGTTGSVLLDETPTSEWKDFTLTMADRTFTSATMHERIWPATGTWNFDNGNLNRMVRNDGVMMDISRSGNMLILDFMISEASGGRPQGINGNYKFTLVKN